MQKYTVAWKCLRCQKIHFRKDLGVEKSHFLIGFLMLRGHKEITAVVEPSA